MAIDASVYAAFKPTNIGEDIQRGQQMNEADSRQRLNAMNLSQMALQNQKEQRAFAEQDAIKQAISKNVNKDGTLNREGVMSDLAILNPSALMTVGQHFIAMDKGQAEAQSAKADSLEKVHAAALPGLEMLKQKGLSAYPAVYQTWKENGLPIQYAPTPDSDPAKIYSWFSSTYPQVKSSVAGLNSQKVQSDIAKNNSEVAMAPAKLSADLYGSRSPNAELTSQYNKDVDSIRKSQLAMQQMHDNYAHPSPQGDASLVLNAFKIKFPNAPDVNSLKELGESQATVDQWKNYFSHASAGGLDQATRDNLMRDGVSTFRANVDSLHGIQDRYKARQGYQGVGDPTLTYEPAIEKTYKGVSELQDKIGPYVPPAERPGIGGKISKFVSGLVGSDANATSPKSKIADESKHVPAGFVLMKSPKGSLMLVKESDKGEAIASGGSLVK